MLHTTTSSITLLLFLLLLALSPSSLGVDIALSSVTDFINFVSDVNSGNKYSSTTVYLGSDITLSESIDPIGNNTYYFLGTFDGQGHVINNLTVNSSSVGTGLFGYSQGLTIRNVVLGDSCSITSTFTGDYNVWVGGLIGYCNVYNIENSVNMASVAFNGNAIGNNGFLSIGGIAGKLYSSNRNAYVKNCVNCGPVTNSGTVSFCVYLGGIAGSSSGDYPNMYFYVHNCINYGTITHNETSSRPYIGGIIGSSYNYAYIENCVSAGKLSAPTTAPEDSHIGNIVGEVGSNVYINYCYYTSDVNASNLYGYGTPLRAIETPTSPTNMDSELVSKLNNNATSCNWDKWFMLYLNGGSINNLTQDRLVEIQGHIPNPVKEGNSFLFWCKDAECSEKFDPDTDSIDGITDLYAGWASGTVTFDFDNGTIVNVIFTYNTEIAYPDIAKEGYTLSWGNYHRLMPAKDITVTAQWTPNNYTVTFDFDNGTTVNETSTYNTEIAYPDIVKEGYTLSWDNYHDLMPPRDITVTAQWTPNNYTVTFDFDNGTTVNETSTYNTEIAYPDMKKEGHAFNRWDNYHELMPARDITVTAQWTPNNYTVTFNVSDGGNVSEASKIITFNEKYGKLPEPKRAGYIFIGWFTNEIDGTEVTNESIVTTSNNHTLYAHWEEVTTQVEIVFSKKSLTQEQVKELIEQYTKAKFEIIEFEEEFGKIRVIIGFASKKEAGNFVNNIKGSSEMENIYRVDLVTKNPGSFSTMLHPFLFFSALLL